MFTNFYYFTESEGFEPSRRLWRLHTFQACSFGQLGQLSMIEYNNKKTEAIFHFCLYDSYGTRTRVTAVKGRCLNRLTNGPVCKYETESKGFEPLRQCLPPTWFPIMLLRPLGQLSIAERSTYSWYFIC